MHDNTHRGTLPETANTRPPVGYAAEGPFPPRLPHSGLGIAAFAASLAGVAILLFTLAFYGAIDAASPSGIDEDSLAFAVAGLFSLLATAALFCALVLGIAALAQSDPPRNKLLAIIGTILSALTLAVLLLMALVGAFLEA